MQQVRSSRASLSDGTKRGGTPVVVRTDLSSLLSDYTNSQRRYNARLASLEREMATLKCRTEQESTDDALNRTFTTKPPLAPPSTPSRPVGSSRIPLPISARKVRSDDAMTTSMTSERPPLPAVLSSRSKTFHHSTSQLASDERTSARSNTAHLKQASPSSDTKVPTQRRLEDVIKANEQLVLDNDRLQSELNRLKTENILLVRSMKAPSQLDANAGNDRIVAERERQELAMELARHVEENKRLRKCLLAQSEKFLSLRQSAYASRPKALDHSQGLESASLNSSRAQQTKSARHNPARRRSLLRRSNDTL